MFMFSMMPTRLAKNIWQGCNTSEIGISIFLNPQATITFNLLSQPRNHQDRMAGMETDNDAPPKAADAAIDHKAAIEYWSNVSTDNAGVLGGYPQVSRVDLQGNTTFLAKLRRKSSKYPPGPRIPRVVDCGAGIGRVTGGFLSKIAEVVDIVEPVVQLTKVITEGEAFREIRDRGGIGTVYNVGLESWTPTVSYDIIWTQWCLGQLTDSQLIEFFSRAKGYVKEGGWIVVKENMSTDPGGGDIFDEADSSVTRTDAKFRSIFEESGLKIVASEVQRGMPKELFPVRSYALQPK
jgi:protein N-terminal methyltransferase